MLVPFVLPEEKPLLSGILEIGPVFFEERQQFQSGFEIEFGVRAIIGFSKAAIPRGPQSVECEIGGIPETAGESADSGRPSKHNENVVPLEVLGGGGGEGILLKIHRALGIDRDGH